MTLLLLLAACAGSAPDSAPDSPQDSPALQGVEMSEVSWSVAVDLDGVEITENGFALFEGLDGAELRLSAAWVSLYVLVLEPCEPLAARAALPWLRSAHAHGLPDHDSALQTSVAVDLLGAGARALASTAFAPERFCEVGFALLRADGSTQGTPEDGALDDATLSIAGERRVGEGGWEPFTLRSALPVEQDVPLGELGEAITLTLRPAGWLQAVDLEGDPNRAGLDALRALAEGATISASVQP